MRPQVLALLCAPLMFGQQASAPAAPKPPDPIATMVGRLDLEKYKATIKGVTKFGDRRQGTDRNRAAVDWIEAQLKSYGCSNISRLKYQYSPSETPRPSGPQVSRDAAPGEVPRIIRDELLRRGLPESRLTVRDNELDAARYALDWARPGDVLALPLHSPNARAAVISILQS